MGGPFQGDCACRGPSNDRYTRFPFHPLLPVPRAKRRILKVAEGESLERGAANLFSHSPKIIRLSFFNCMSCRFRYLWCVWECSSVFEVLYWTFYHPDLKEERAERLKYPWHGREIPLSFTLSLASKVAGVVTGAKRGSLSLEQRGCGDATGSGDKKYIYCCKGARWYKVKVFLGTEEGAVFCPCVKACGSLRTHTA